MQALTFESLLDLTYSRYWEGTKGEKTALINAKSVIAVLGPSKPIKSLDIKDIDKLIKSLKTQGNSNSTINRKLSTLAKMLDYALSRGYISYRPAIESLPENQARTRWLTQEEEVAILTYFYTSGINTMASLTILGIDTGLRVSELLNIVPSRDVRNNILYPYESLKNGNPKSIPLTKRVQQLLESHPDPLKGLDQKQINYQWNKMKAALGFSNDPELVPHCLRHTFCSRLVQKGVPIQVVGDLAGHKSLQSTRRYSHLQIENLKQAIELLEA